MTTALARLPAIFSVEAVAYPLHIPMLRQESVMSLYVAAVIIISQSQCVWLTGGNVQRIACDYGIY